MNKKDICIIISAHNEEKYIARVLKKIIKITPNIIVVDDGSRDDTQKIAKSFTAHVLSHKINLGKGAAMKTGCLYAFKYLNSEAIIFMDGDDQHSAKEIKKFLKKLIKGNEVVLGVRSFEKEMPKIKVLSNIFASYMVKMLFGLYIPDIPSGYKAISKKTFKEIFWNSNNYDVELEIAVKIAAKKIPFETIKISTIYHDHDKGMTFIDALYMMFKLIKWRINL